MVVIDGDNTDGVHFGGSLANILRRLAIWQPHLIFDDMQPGMLQEFFAREGLPRVYGHTIRIANNGRREQHDCDITSLTYSHIEIII